MAFYPALHGVRGLAATAVLLFHAQGIFFAWRTEWSRVTWLGVAWDPMFLLRSGWVGVDWFFVLSGFVLGATLWRQSLGWSTLTGFWRRRVVRIYPALWLQLAVVVPFMLLTGRMLEPDWSRLLGNALLWLRPLPGGAAALNGVYWTLVWEMSFYLLLPALLAVSRRIGVWALLVAALAWQLAQRFWVPALSGWPALHDGLVQAQFLLSGLQVVFVCGLALNAVRWSPSPRARAGWLVALLMVFLGALYLFEFLGQTVSRWHWSVFVCRTAMAGLIAAIIYLLLQPPPGARWLASRPLVWLGEMSYGLYLWHLPVQRTMTSQWREAWATPAGSLLAMAMSFAVSLLLAALSYYLVERPLVRRFSGRVGTHA